jgi:hypothetical protein
MKRFPSVVLAALVATLASPRPEARAAEFACPGVAVEADAEFRSHAPGLAERIQGELAARSDLDRCARVALRLEHGTLIGVAVTLPDGRSASRHVTREDDLVPTLQALLLVPARPPAAPLRQTPTAPAPQRRAGQALVTPTLDQAGASGVSGSREFGIELSVISGVRIGDGQFGAGAGVLSLLELHGWLIGFEGRADSYRPIRGGDPETALQLAVLAGRRFDLGSVALDLTAGPGIAMNGIVVPNSEVTRVETDGMGMPPPTLPRAPERSAGPLPRLLLGARVGFSPRSVFRTFAGVDAEFGPARAADPQTGALPRFALGLALGATVGTP